MTEHAYNPSTDGRLAESLATPSPSITPSPSTVLVTTSALALAACGTEKSGGDTPVASVASPPVAVIAAAPTDVQASRFLAQASMGATTDSIAAVISKGYSGWIEAQFAMPRAISHFDWLAANGYGPPSNGIFENGFDSSMWRQLIVEPDQLRQRVGTALLDFLVVSFNGTNFAWRSFGVGAYVDLILDNAFGNYREILTRITYSSAMATFLTFRDNRKGNPSTGSQPDENYARELLQLFTIGLHQMNMDGSPRLSGGQPIETYTNADVSGLARVFTGLSYDPQYDWTLPERERHPLVMIAEAHETGPSTFLGTSVSGEGNAAIKVALDAIFAHPNVPPFVSRQLIQRLVTSNPSPAYVGRVAAAFADNGQGVRGDMKAVIRAILLDTEARSDAALGSTSAGRLRPPVLRFTAWARAFGVSSASNAWAIGSTASPGKLGQSPCRSPSVFNFFRPGYAPPNTAISAAGLVAPEFQITDEQTVISYVNFMQSVIAAGINDVKPDYSAALAKAADAAELVTWLNTLLAAGQLSGGAVAAIRSAIEGIDASSAAGARNRVSAAVLLVLSAPEFLVVR